MQDSELQQLYKSDRNPVQEQRYQELLKQQGLSSGDLGKGGNGADSATLDPNGSLVQGSQALNLAKKAQAMQVEANQPAIATLNTQKSTLDTKYDELLASIKGSEQVATNAQTLATSNELGRRGITSDSGVGQNQMASALLPVSTQFGQLTANTGLARQQDLGNIAQLIAQLQTGNVPQSLNFATGIGGLSNQAQQISNQFQLGKADLTNQQILQKLANQFINVPAGNNLVNTLNNFAINPSLLTSAGGGVANLR